MKKQYEKPTAEKINFSIEDALMDDAGGGGTGGIPSTGGSGTGGIVPPWSSLDEGYQNP